MQQATRVRGPLLKVPDLTAYTKIQKTASPAQIFSYYSQEWAKHNFKNNSVKVTGFELSTKDIEGKIIIGNTNDSFDRYLDTETFRVMIQTQILFVNGLQQMVV